MKKIATYILIFVLLLGIFPAFAETVSAESVSDLKKELQELKEERENISSSASDAEQKIKENEARQKEVEKKISELDVQIDDTETKLEKKQAEITTTANEIETIVASITKTEKEIAETEAEIVTLNNEIDELIIRIDERNEVIKSRLRSMQKNGGDSSYFQVLFGARSFSDFISRLSAVSKILDSDNKIMEQQKEDQALLETKLTDVEDKKEQLVEKKNELDASKQKLETKKQALVNQRQELAELQEALNIERQNQTALKGELEEEHADLEDYKVSLADQQEIKRKEAGALQQAIQAAEAAEREKKKQEQQLATDSGGTSDTATPSAPADSSGGPVLQWPASTRRVTSPFNLNRLHPVYGYVRPHRGMDIASWGTQSIYAAETGVVVATYKEHDGKMNGYGDAILITHYIDLNGNGQKQQVSTFYAHLRAGSTRVSPGQTVQRGQQIALMGATGVGTGQHLHFEVHKGGWAHSNAVNPANYLY
ncbi:peptidoglycan hydrolase CwlO-like protein [Streptohalobacillus salinus]|uniref:Peptidoglycan hydrolase CwlO-like protein n=1 Tax=Streptohalobacillus salinus TaxID=621096 RepID=A0A2V3WEH6_9BACI|nr:peptidoglycan DD-metalloendopeptidase family protein [Streptohalobacillus salinus]PXW91488.1 peptidoglycan hydrolase CwlO-like protein [Streptohalobacillus salinus]